MENLKNKTSKLPEARENPPDLVASGFISLASNRFRVFFAILDQSRSIWTDASF